MVSSLPSSSAPRAELLWQAALERSASALGSGALVPLSTELVPAAAHGSFVVRRLLSQTPKHLRTAGPKPNPFLPWDPALEVERLGTTHLALLNKYPVQEGHILLISQEWQPQAGWLSSSDWRAVAQVGADTGGLWFFNSCAAAGASQPHRHLQLLPRRSGDLTCPLAPSIQAQLRGEQPPWPWCYSVSPRLQATAGLDAAAAELESLYHHHSAVLDLGTPQRDPVPRQPYNLLFDDQWFMTVQRTREHWAGFSVNALGFAGSLLLTDRSDQHWLERHGPLALLEAVAAQVP